MLLSKSKASAGASSLGSVKCTSNFATLSFITSEPGGVVFVSCGDDDWSDLLVLASSRAFSGF